MDSSTTSLCLSLGYRASIPAARPRWLLRRTRPSNHSRHGHPGDSERATLSLAECICTAVDRLDPRECLDHVLIFNECGLRRILKPYFEYYEKSCTHLGLAKDAPIPRPVQPPSLGRVIALPQVGGLHHRYERRAA